ncbi:DUF3616 domain-containing protein [Pseudoponticoccus marisrubri]|uniref:DUF3616 domain-containing protein n=1 Tax=Pseudoponticoccus marisrubri TaxID=1685382 RepID=A0A0W7WGJ1_9RHOB|nr:DUF3616 domain-containing protein [Pseudoponticoccus marisrubri]KUF09620.1 hypothetical protein AVJ23_17215 [Pseudoponticoccus marisrubri]
MPDQSPERTITLHFQSRDVLRHVDDPLHRDLSTATRWKDSLLVTCDETAGVDRLTRIGPDDWGDHRHFNLGQLIDLPDGPDGEMDIEGLHCDGDWLWVAGSHSLKRKKAKRPDKSAKKALDRMTRIARDPNRWFLGRFPLVEHDGGVVPVAIDGTRRAACIELKRTSPKLIRWLRGDPHLDPFLDLPSKENGLDIEGIVARDMRVLLGLRGPVLRGHAVILDLEMKRTRDGFLKPRKIEGGRRYRKHLVPTAGQGIRDLAFDGDDLLILTGPTMAGDGPAAVLRWPDALDHARSGVLAPGEVDHALDLPYRGMHDHPEGLVHWPAHGKRKPGWMVVYDSPAERRVSDRGQSVTADIWRF